MEIRTYDQCKEKYLTTKPIRGRSEDVRPLDDRRRDWERVVALPNDVYALRFHKTDVVKFYPDKSIGYSTGGWSSQTTGQFIERFAPVNAYISMGHIWIRESAMRRFFPLPTDSTEIRITRDGKLDHTVHTHYKVVSKEKMFEQRAKFRDFLSWVKAMLKIGQLHTPYVGYTQESVFMRMESLTLDDYPHLLTTLRRRTNINTNTYDSIYGALTRMIKEHAPVWVDQVEQYSILTNQEKIRYEYQKLV